MLNAYNTLFTTLSNQILPLQHDFLQYLVVFPSYPKENSDMLADILLMTCHVSLGMVGPTEFDDMLGQHSEHFPEMEAY